MDKIFGEGIIFKKIPTKFGEMKKLSIKVDEFIEFLNRNRDGEWLNLNINKGKDSGKYYIELDTRKPDGGDYKAKIESDEEFEKSVKSDKKKKDIEEINGEEISIDEIPF